MQPTTAKNEQDMINAGHDAAAGMQAGDVLALVGDLGSGKTHFTKGLAVGLGSKAEINSPTFSLVHEHREQSLPIFHFDFYRIESAEELIAIGWDDYLDAGGICIIEWADRFPEVLPAYTRWLKLEIQEDRSRLISPIEKP